MYQRIKNMSAVKDELLVVLNDWIADGSIPEVDWKNRQRDFDFQGIVRARNEAVSRLPTYACRACPEFDGHVSV